MKRVKAACILQTLVFAQKEDCGLSRNSILDNNRREFAHYKQTLERTHTRYQIVSCDEQEDGSLIVRVRKQYNDKADVSEYFHSLRTAAQENWAASFLCLVLKSSKRFYEKCPLDKIF